MLTIGQGSKGIDELLRKSFESFQFDIDFDFPANITHRGMADIPNYDRRKNYSCNNAAQPEFLGAGKGPGAQPALFRLVFSSTQSTRRTGFLHART